MRTRTLTPDLLRRIDAYWRAANYLSVGQIYLRDNPLLRRPLALADVKHMLLGHWGTTPGQNFIYAHLNRVIKQVRPEHDLRLRPRPWRPGGGGQHLPRRHLQRDLSRHQPGRDRVEATLHAVLVSRRDSQPRLAGMPRLDPRRRRARLFAQPFLRRGVRQSGPDRRLRRRRRRGGDRPAGHGLAFQQVSRSGHRRRGAADPASQWLQDLQPDRARAHHPRGAGAVAARLRLDAVLRRRSRARADA